MGCTPSRPRRFDGTGTSYIDHPPSRHSTGDMGTKHCRRNGSVAGSSTIGTSMGHSGMSGRHGGMSSSGISSGTGMGRSGRTSGGMSSGMGMGRSSRSGGGLGGMTSGFGRSRRC
ncbi:hypothetical protein BKA58DRAFT_404703 [Alternaria rosae]|uniref:uncharacterized protein n=1 Tax=Alternaria rosae TaxID=1187941 RepID=UPI001E8CEF9F|nr:uncharacterized protein BKA58DRAFT_404703 [Alternaria rosae]KAH6864901.1 hypothetical protein BKA58DRAFT_404703 [Alternaria rosae]